MGINDVTTTTFNTDIGEEDRIVSLHSTMTKMAIDQELVKDIQFQLAEAQQKIATLSI